MSDKKDGVSYDLNFDFVTPKDKEFLALQSIAEMRDDFVQSILKSGVGTWVEPNYQPCVWRCAQVRRLFTEQGRRKAELMIVELKANAPLLPSYINLPLEYLKPYVSTRKVLGLNK
jgi:hypothetical protein